eukprot:gene12084-5577_t
MQSQQTDTEMKEVSISLPDNKEKGEFLVFDYDQTVPLKTQVLAFAKRIKEDEQLQRLLSTEQKDSIKGYIKDCYSFVNDEVEGEATHSEEEIKQKCKELEDIVNEILGTIFEDVVVTPVKAPSPLPELKKKIYNTHPMQISWKNLEFEVRVGGGIKRPWDYFKKKQILHPMDGFVQPGQVLAVMGPSGSGKTSLLNILAGRTKNSAGGVFINGEPVTKKFRSVSAYVQQDDILNGNLTVFEALMFTALLRLPFSYSLSQKKQKVLDIIEELGLTHTIKTKIGIPGLSKGISGGERKRVSMAVELLTSPSVLFLDEPTSGLDSKTALSIIETINRLARLNHTIICTIHQPRSDIFAIFDKLLLLSSGQVAYFGDAKKAVPYFADLGYPIPKNYNPADFYIDLVTKTANDTKELEELKQQEAERTKLILDYHREKVTIDIPEPEVRGVRNVSKYSTSFLNEVFVLFIRALLSLLRDRVLTIARLFQTLVMSILVGFIYFGFAHNQKTINDRIGCIFFIMINQTMQNVFGGLQVFHLEKVVFLRERASKTYRVGSYYIAKTLAEIPSIIIFPLIFGTISYWLVGFKPTAEAFFTFLVVLISLSFCAQALGLLLSAGTPSPDVAMAVAPVLITILMLFGGFYLNPDNMDPWVIWIYYISLFRYSFQALVINEFTDQTFNCLDSELVSGNCPITTGQQVLINRSMEHMNVWLNILTLWGIFFALRVLGYLVIRFYQRPKIQR